MANFTRSGSLPYPGNSNTDYLLLLWSLCSYMAASFGQSQSKLDMVAIEYASVVDVRNNVQYLVVYRPLTIQRKLFLLESNIFSKPPNSFLYHTI